MSQIVPTPLTSSQLAKLRSDKQYSRLYLGIYTPETVFTARVNQTFSSLDMVDMITYDEASGTYTDIKPGQTLLVGSAAGLSDIGVCRVRKAATGTVIYIGETSDIKWENDLYLTVVNDFGLWPKHPRISGKKVYMDADVEYTDQHSVFDPVPVLGSSVAVWLENGSATIPFDASDSYVYGSMISSYAWSVSPETGAAFDNPTAAAPTLTVNAAGQYVVACTVTAANGKSFTAYRYVLAYDDDNPAIGEFVLQSCSADIESGGWRFEVSVYDDDIADNIRAGSFVILFERASFDNTAGSVGTINGREHIIAMGWVSGETIIRDPQVNTTTFVVENAAGWLNKIEAFPVGLRLTKTASAWTDMPGLTIDRAIWHLLHWHTTATTVMDCVLTGDSRYATELSAPMENIWQQIQVLAGETILARAGVNRLNQLFVQIPYIYSDSTARASVPVIMDITTADRGKTLTIPHNKIPVIAQTHLSGINVNSSGKAVTFFSLSPGHTPHKTGKVRIIDRLLLTSQSAANELTGMLAGEQNNPWSNFEIEFAGNNRAFDIAPNMVATADLGEYNGVILPIGIDISYDPRNGYIKSSAMFSALPDREIGINGDIPKAPKLPPSPPLPPLPPLPPPPPIPLGTIPARGVVLLASEGLFYCADINADDPEWTDLSGGVTFGTSYLSYMAVHRYGKNVYIRKRFPGGTTNNHNEIYLAQPEPGIPASLWISQEHVRSMLDGDPDASYGVLALDCDSINGTLLYQAGKIGDIVGQMTSAYWFYVPLKGTPELRGLVANTTFYYGFFPVFAFGNGLFPGKNLYLGNRTYRTPDNGQTSYSVSIPVTSTFIPAFKVINTGRFFVHGYNSDDFGATWTAWSPGSNKLTKSDIVRDYMAASPDGSVMLCTGYDSSESSPYGVYRSVDGGNNWTRVSNDPVAPTRGFVGLGSGIWLRHRAGAVEVSYDDGETWIDRTGNLMMDFGDGSNHMYTIQLEYFV